MRLSYVTLCTSIFIICYLITQLSSFFDYWNKREKENIRAHKFLETEACLNPRVRAELADFNLCHKSEEIISQSPMFRALYDIAEDNSICGRGKCYMLYVDVTSNIHKIIITLGIMLILVCFLSGARVKQHRNEDYLNSYRLPLKVD